MNEHRRLYPTVEEIEELERNRKKFNLEEGPKPISFEEVSATRPVPARDNESAGQLQHQ